MRLRHGLRSGWDAETALGAGTFAAAWNGKTWKDQSTALIVSGTNPYFYGVSCTSTRDCEAVGQYDSSAAGHAAPLAEKWNGASWTVQPSVDINSSANINLDVASLHAVSCTSAEECEAVGFDLEYKGGGFAEVWNGHVWAHQSVPQPDRGATTSVLDGISCTTAGSCEAVGYDLVSGGRDVPLAEYFGGSAWQPQSVGPRMAATRAR